MATIDVAVEDSAARVLADHATPKQVEATEAGQWQGALWDAVTQAGLETAFDDGLAEGLGSAAGIARAAGATPTPVPLVETMMARGLALAAGIVVGPGPMTIAPPRFAEVRLLKTGGGAKLTGAIAGVPFGRWCTHVAVMADNQLMLVPAQGLSWITGVNTAGEPLDEATLDVTLPADAVGTRAPAAHGAIDELGALMRSLQMAGGIRSCLALTLQYANDRVQFGRSIGKFQAIQHAIAVMAEHAAAAGAAADLAVKFWGTPSQRLFLASAKIRCGEAAGIAAETAHQVHGAIGFTREHRLHHVTRRLWAWRDEFGHEGDWSVELGRATLARGADGLWPMVTGAMDAGALETRAMESGAMESGAMETGGTAR